MAKLPISIKPKHNCCVCLEPARREYNLVGFGCCSAKVCLTCKDRLKSCPQCRKNTIASHCKVCLAIANSERLTDNMVLTQIAVQMYDNLMTKIQGPWKFIKYTNIESHCHSHIVSLIRIMETMGMHVRLDQEDNLLDVQFGYITCGHCGWFCNSVTECGCYHAVFSTNSYQGLIDINAEGDGDIEDEICLPIPEVKIGPPKHAS